jgi:hypothetical protein
MPEASTIFKNGCTRTTPRLVPGSRRSRSTTNATGCWPYGGTPYPSARLLANGAPLKACVRHSRSF